MYSEKYLAELNLVIYLQITSLIGFYITFTNVNATLKQCQDKVNFASMLLHSLRRINVNIDPHRWNKVDLMLNCWFGRNF